MPESVPVLTTPALPVNTYTSRPVSIEAIQWDGTDERSAQIRQWVERTHEAGAVVDTDHIQHLWDFDAGCYVMPTGKTVFAPYSERCLIVLTLEGEMVAEPGRWIIRGTEGEFYPCIDSVFQRKYEAAVVPGDVEVQRLYATTDAMVWAEEFVKMNPHVDEGTMLGWFANAMQTAIDLTKRKLDHDMIISADMRRHLERMFDGPIEVKPRSLDMTTVDVNPIDITADGGHRKPGIEVRNIVLVTKAED